MKRFNILKIIIFFLVLGMIHFFPSHSCPSGNTETEKRIAKVSKKAEKVVKEKSKKKSAIQYRPPKRGKPGKHLRVGGGTRGAGDGLPYLVALVPEHTAFTIKARPSLYWFISDPKKCIIEITLNDEDSIKPIMNLDLSAPESEGIQCLRLADYGITLQPGMEYQWFVAIVSNPEHRSNDIVASGTIKRIEPSKALKERIDCAENAELPFIYAEEGIWYDCLSEISDRINANPDSKDLIILRAQLLEQIGLREIVDDLT